MTADTVLVRRPTAAPAGEVRAETFTLDRPISGVHVGIRTDGAWRSWRLIASVWDEYQARYELAITETTTHWSPWYVVPADHKWVRDVAVASLLVHVLRELDPKIPPPEEGLEGLVVE